MHKILGIEQPFTLEEIEKSENSGESQSLQVSKLIRIGFGPIKLPENLGSGQYKTLDKNEIKKVMKTVGLED